MRLSYRSFELGFPLLGFLALLIPSNRAINYTQCAIDAESIFLQAPNATILVQPGEYTQNLSSAWGIRYDSCNQLCGSKSSWEPFDWTFFTSSFASWLLPYLALAAQMPYEAKDIPGNLTILFITLGSPMLVAYSLILTIANTRWINHAFRMLKDENKETGGEWVEAIAAARRCFLESQQSPTQIVQGPERELAHLIVLPQNRSWWTRLEKELKKTRRPWTYSLIAQLFWVFFAQLLAIIDFLETSSTSSTIGLGLTINSLCIWMIPVALGWVCVGTQRSAVAFKAATMAVNPPEIGDGQAGYGRNVGIRVRIAYASTFWLEKDGTELQREERDNRNLANELEITAGHMKKTFLGFSISGYEPEPGPIYNFARLWTHRSAISHVIDGFRGLNTKLKDGTRRTVHGGPWDPKQWDRNFQGSPVALSKYISSHRKNFDTDRLRIYSSKSSASLTKISLLAFIGALVLQWGTTGAAILIAYKTPTVGLGCKSGIYLLYGAGATFSCLFLAFSSYLSHIWSARVEQHSVRPSKSLLRLLGLLAVLTRGVGNCIALLNACWVVIASSLQFTELFSNCWCESDVLGPGPVVGWVPIRTTDAQIAESSRAWWGAGVALSLITVLILTLFVVFGTGGDTMKE